MQAATRLLTFFCLLFCREISSTNPINVRPFGSRKSNQLSKLAQGSIPQPSLPVCGAKAPKSRAIAWLLSGSYRESGSVRKNLKLNIDLLEREGYTVNIFAVTSPPMNVQLLEKEFSHHLVIAHVLSEDERASEKALVEAATGSPVEKKGHLLQWYKFFIGLKQISDYEQREGICYSFVAKQRFDHNLQITSQAAAKRLLAQIDREVDTLWHANSDYFFLGERSVMGNLANALFSGGCATHAIGTTFDGNVLSRPNIDLKYIGGHGVMPLEAERFKDPRSFLMTLQSPRNLSLSANDTGVFFDRYHNYATRPPHSPPTWVRRTPKEHYCYSEAELVGTVLTHRLAFYDASASPFNLLAGHAATDWQQWHTIGGVFKACGSTPEVGRPRNNEWDVKLFLTGGQAKVRVNRYIAEISQHEDEFFQQHIKPVLQECASSSATRSHVSNMKTFSG